MGASKSRANQESESAEPTREGLRGPPHDLDDPERSSFAPFASLDENSDVRSTGTSGNSLPHPSGPFVQRRRQHREVGALLAASRLVTIVGPAGVGKSSLALRVAARAASRFPGGVWLAPLGSVADPADVPGAVAASLPVGDASPVPRSAKELAGHIGSSEMLLVLDDCAHLIDACAQLATVLLESCPALGILAASREPLAIAGERLAVLAPLSLPPAGPLDAATLAASEAGELFVAGAAAVSPGFTLSDSNTRAVAEICRTLDGLPLAVELASARVASLSVDEILERLDNPLALLKHGRRTAHSRHRSLEAAFEWSHDLLTPPQAVLLRRLAVFAGGWTIDAAEDVCAGGDVADTNIVDLLDDLVRKSLVVAESGDGRVRYHLLNTVRHWAGMKLDASAEAPDIRERHALWYLGMAEEVEDGRRVGRPARPSGQLDAEYENLRAALEWARSGNELGIGVRLATALTPLWRARHEAPVDVAWLDWALATADTVGSETTVDRSSPGARRSRATGHDHGATSVHHDGNTCNCNPMTRMFEDPRRTLADIEDRMAFCRRTGDTKALAHLFVTAGQAHFFLSEPQEARINFEECVHLGREAADDEVLRAGLLGLARVAFLVGDFTMVETSAIEVLTLARADRNVVDASMAVAFFGDLARARGDWEEARRALGSADEMSRAANVPLPMARTQYLLARLDEDEGEFDADDLVSRYEKSLALGRAARGPAYHEVRCLIGIGSARRAGRDNALAAGCLLEALEKAGTVGDLHAGALALEQLSRLAAEQGDADEARTLADRAVALHHQAGARPGVVSSIELLASLMVDTGRHASAVRLFGAAQAARERGGYARPRSGQERHDADLVVLRQALGEKGFAAAWADGAVLSLDEAVVHARRGRGLRDRPNSGWESLTPAELDVVHLVGEGLTNAEVGTRLFISPRTVGHHLTHVYDKLGIRSRHALMKELSQRRR